MKKIVFVIESLYGGGAERVTVALANEICKLKERDVHILTYDFNAEKSFFVEKKVTIHNQPQKMNSNRIAGIISRILYLRNEIKMIKPDCVISLAMPRTNVLVQMAMLGQKAPLILSERNDPRRFPKTLLWRFVRNCSYVFCNGLVFQTLEAKNYFPKFIRKKVVVICNPITGSLPQRYDGERDRKIVNWCRLDDQKNLDLLIDAFEEISSMLPGYNLHIFGEGPERERLEKKIKDIGLSDRIFLPGYSNHIYDEVLNAALFVSTSDYEGISNSMLEAIALGIPSICTDCPVGGAREVIEDGVNGLLIPVGDKDALKDAMVRVLTNEIFSKQISKNGIMLRERISVKKISEQWEAYIHKIQKKKK